jgi:hypothetical protein
MEWTMHAVVTRPGRLSSFFGAFLAALVFALSAPAASAQRASEYDIKDELYHRYRGMIDGYLKEAIALELVYRRDLVGKVVDPFGKPLLDVTVLELLINARGALARRLSELDAARNQNGGNPNLGTFFAEADRQMIYAIEDIWSIDINLAGLRISALATRQSGEAWDLSNEYSSRRDALRGKFSGKEYDAELDKISTELGKRQRAELERTLKDYLAIQDEFVAHLKARAGDAWRLLDFNERRLRRDAVRGYHAAIFNNFCYELGARDRQAITRRAGGNWVSGTSKLDFFVNSVGSPDRLIVKMVREVEPPKASGDPENRTPALGNNVWKMNQALAKLPVEKLRQYDKALPKIAMGDEKLEPIGRILIARLGRFFQLQNEQDRLHSELAKLIGEPDAPKLPDTAGLLQDFDAAFAKKKAFDEAMTKRKTAQETYRKAAADAATAQKALQDTEAQLLLVDDGTDGIVPFKTKIDRAERAKQIKARIDGEVADLKKRLAQKEDPVLRRRLNALLGRNVDKEVDDEIRRERQAALTPDQMRKKIDDRIKLLKLNLDKQPELAARIAELEQQRATVDKVVDAALKPQRDALAAANEARDKAQKAYDALPDPDPNEHRKAYAAAKARYDAAIATLPPKERTGLAALPNELDAAVGKAADAIKNLDARIAAIRQRGDNRQLDIAGMLGEIERNEHELAEVGQRVAEDRVAGSNAAEKAMEDLSKKKVDETVMTELKKLKTGLSKGKDFLDTTKGRAEKLGYVNDFLLKSKEGGALIKTVTERIDTITKTTKMIGEADEGIIRLEAINRQLSSNDPAIQAELLATVLDVGGKFAGKVPVMGPTLGRFFSFYSQAATACVNAIVKIQGNLIEVQIENLFPHAERHLYTLDEVKASVTTGDPEKIALILQVRRVIFLAHADSWNDAMEWTLQRAQGH